MKRIIVLSMLVVAVLTFSCQNEKVETLQDDYLTEKAAQLTLTEVQVEAATTETEYEVEFFANAEETLTRWWRMGKLFRWNNKLRYRINHCPDVEIIQGDNDGYPKTIKLNYGDSTVLNNGKVLSGEIIIVLSAPKKSKDYTRTVTYNDFGMDSLLINGGSTVIVDKVDEMFRIFTTDFTITLADGSTLNRTSERIWQWVEGMDTEEDQLDDVIHITGIVNAELNGETYKKEILDHLVRKGDCRYIVQGTVEVTLGIEQLCFIDYGEGDCDQYATMTKDGESYEIDLAKKKMKGKNNQNGNANQNKKS
jgi:hypothetical protein